VSVPLSDRSDGSLDRGSSFPLETCSLWCASGIPKARRRRKAYPGAGESASPSQGNAVPADRGTAFPQETLSLVSPVQKFS
jgi:hypothetical protein